VAPIVGSGLATAAIGIVGYLAAKAIPPSWISVPGRLPAAARHGVRFHDRRCALASLTSAALREIVTAGRRLRVVAKATGHVLSCSSLLSWEVGRCASHALLVPVGALALAVFATVAFSAADTACLTVGSLSALGAFVTAGLGTLAALAVVVAALAVLVNRLGGSRVPERPFEPDLALIAACRLRIPENGNDNIVDCFMLGNIVLA
jgi:hypothetical protein